jgi:TorA maturation chaperone TorD
MTGAATVRTANERAQVYGLLAMIFRRPLDAAQIDGLKQKDMLAALAAAGMDLVDELDGTDTETLRETLAIDFTQMFHNPESRFLPYEGLMLSLDTDLFGEQARRVAHFMADVGYRVAAESGELADHIAVELSFLADLAQRESAALEAGDSQLARRAQQIQTDFLERHIGCWVDKFAQRVRSLSGTAFYAAMAQLAADFITSEFAPPATRTAQDA